MFNPSGIPMKVSFKQFSDYVDADESNLSEEQLNEIWPFGNGEAKAKADAAKAKALAAKKDAEERKAYNDQVSAKNLETKKQAAELERKAVDDARSAERKKNDEKMRLAGKVANAPKPTDRRAQAMDRTADIGGFKYESVEEILEAIRNGEISKKQLSECEGDLATEAISRILKS